MLKTSDPAREWASRVQNNVFSGGVAGFLLVVLSLTAMIVATIAAIIAGYKILVALGFMPAKRNLWPFAAVGVYAGMMVFRVATPVFYGLTREGRMQRVEAGGLL